MDTKLPILILALCLLLDLTIPPIRADPNPEPDPKRGGGFNVGRQTGGSGQPRRHYPHSPNARRAEDRARNAGKGSPPVHHQPHKPGQLPHYHPTNKHGQIRKDGSHYTYPRRRGG